MSGRLNLEKRGNDEAERAKERYQDGLGSNCRPRSKNPNATVFRLKLKELSSLYSSLVDTAPPIARLCTRGGAIVLQLY